MDIKKPQLAWAQTLNQATMRATAEGEIAVQDPGRQKAAQAILEKAQLRAETLNGSPLDAAERLWQRRQEAGMPQLVEQTLAQGVGEDFRAQVKQADRADLAMLVDALTINALESGKDAEVLAQLLDLKIVCEAGANLIPEYNRRLRSMPSRDKKDLGGPVDKNLQDSLQAITERIHEVRQEMAGGNFRQRIRENAGKISSHLWGAGQNAINKVTSYFPRSDPESPGILKRAAQAIKTGAGKLVPKSLQELMETIKNSAEIMVNSLSGVEKDIDDPKALVDRFVKALPTTKATFDPKADAIAIGRIQEATAGLLGANGHELVYMRETGELRLNRLDGTGARLGVGGTMRAFTRNLYGNAESIGGTDGRDVLELGVIAGHLGLYRSHRVDGQKSSARGFNTTLSLGYNVSIPLLSDQSIFTLGETPLTTVQLSQAQQEKIEGILGEGVPKSARLWTSAMRGICRFAQRPQVSKPEVL